MYRTLLVRFVIYLVNEHRIALYCNSLAQAWAFHGC